MDLESLPLPPDRCARVRARGDQFDAPRDGGARRHQGLDIGCPIGTPVFATVTGRVLNAPSLRTETGRTGLGVSIRDASGAIHHFAHLSRVDVSPGPIRAGAQLGLSGATGNATPDHPHLHYQITDASGARVNPFPLVVAAYDRAQSSTAAHAPITTTPATSSTQGPTMEDAEFRRLVSLNRAWAQNFRYPQSWWSGSQIRMQIARQGRETAQREVRERTAEAERLRAQNTPEARLQSDAIISRLTEYSRRMQQLRTRLDEGESLTDQAMRELQNGALSFLQTGANALQAVATPLLQGAGGAIFLVVAAWLFMKGSGSGSGRRYA